jgi:hypothetical protein
VPEDANALFNLKALDEVLAASRLYMNDAAESR